MEDWANEQSGFNPKIEFRCEFSSLSTCFQNVNDGLC